MNRKLHAGLLAILMFSQAARSEDVVTPVLMIGGAALFMRWLVSPYDSYLVRDARGLINNINIESQPYGDNDVDLQYFARRNGINASNGVSEVYNFLIRQRNKAIELATALESRIENPDSSVNTREMGDCIEALGATVNVLNAKIQYIEKYTLYFSVYSLDQHAHVMLKDGCKKDDDVSCVGEFEKTIRNVEKAMHHIEGKDFVLYNNVRQETHPQLIEMRDNINARIRNDIERQLGILPAPAPRLEGDQTSWPVAEVQAAATVTPPTDLPVANIEHTDEIQANTKSVKHEKKEYSDQDEQDFMHFILTMNCY